MRNLVFLFVFIFSPVAIVSGDLGKTERDKLSELFNTPKTLKDVKNLEDLIEVLSNWQVASATYYDPKDSTQTKKKPDGIGSFGRKIKSGSIALGSSFTKILKKEKVELFFQIKGLNIVIPYGKEIFRVDDTMKSDTTRMDINNFYIDFFHEDLTFKQKRQGRFKVMFRIYKIIKTASMTSCFFYYFPRKISFRKIFFLHDALNNCIILK